MSNNWSQRKLGLLPEGPDQSGPALAAPQLASRFPSQVRQVFRTEVRQGMTFEMSPNVFDGIESRCVGRQLRQHEVTCSAFDVGAHGSAAMHCQAIPNHQQLAGNLAAKVAEELHRLPAFDAAAIQAKVKFPPSDARDDREFAPRMTEHQLRRLPLGGPSAYDAGPFRQATFVHKDEGAAFLQGLFFNAGQVCFFQRAIAGSSRCAAFPAGRWILQPIRPSNRQTWPGCRRTPLCRWINSATRGSVHKPLRNPWAWAPRTNAFSNCCLWVGLSLGRRPKGRRFQAVPRTDWRCCSHRSAVGRLTPQRRATSAWATPWPKSRIPSRRRFSMPSRSRLILVVMREDCVTYLCESQ